MTIATIRIPARRGARIRVSPKAERTYNGRVFHSKAEARKAAELDLLKKCGEIVGWEPQVPYPITVRGAYICTVIVDFRVYPFKGSMYLLEVKGHETEIYQLKRKLFEACYPTLDYRTEAA